MDTTMNTAIRASIPLLTDCLTKVYPSSQLDALHVILMSTLSEHLAPSWQPERPAQGAALRSLLISPMLPAPDALRAAAKATRIHERDWILLLTRGDAWEIFIDPGMVSYRIGNENSVHMYWQAKSRTPSMVKRLPWDNLLSPSLSSPPSTSRSARMVVEEVPSWMDNVPSHFPDTPKFNSGVFATPIRRPSPEHASAAPKAAYVPPHRLTTTSLSAHIRTQSEISSALSLSSASSSDSSFYDNLSLSMSSLSIDSSASSFTGPSTRASSPVGSDSECSFNNVQSPAEVEVYDYDSDEDASVYVNASHCEVVEYECGKVGVLGGAVMLGMPKSATKPKAMPVNAFTPSMAPRFGRAF